MCPVRWGLLAIAAATSGCDVLFQLRAVPDAGFLDAPVYFEHDAAPLDTSGWPTDGKVVPRTCLAGSTVNEDGDARTDECDNCPLDVNDDQVDADKDGIGDVCDPHPSYAVEKLAYFEGFNTDLPTAGVPFSGSWVVSGGLLRQRNQNNIRTLFVLAGGPWREPVIELRFSNVARTSQSNNWFAGGYMLGMNDPVSNTPDGTSCRVHYASNVSDLQMVRSRLDGTRPVTSAPIPRVNGSVSLVLGAEQQLGVLHHCDGVRDIKPPPELTTQLLLVHDATDPEPARFGVWTANAQADFEGYAVYETTYP
jgi:hypothetical protein